MEALEEAGNKRAAAQLNLDKGRIDFDKCVEYTTRAHARLERLRIKEQTARNDKNMQEQQRWEAEVESQRVLLNDAVKAQQNQLKIVRDLEKDAEKAEHEYFKTKGRHRRAVLNDIDSDSESN